MFSIFFLRRNAYYSFKSKSVRLKFTRGTSADIRPGCNGNWQVLLVYQDSYTNVIDSTVKVIVSHHKIKCSRESGSSISWMFPLGHIHLSTSFTGTEPLNYWKAITVKDKNKFLQALHWPINELIYLNIYYPPDGTVRQS